MGNDIQMILNCRDIRGEMTQVVEITMFTVFLLVDNVLYTHIRVQEDISQHLNLTEPIQEMLNLVQQNVAMFKDAKDSTIV